MQGEPNELITIKLPRRVLSRLASIARSRARTLERKAQARDDTGTAYVSSPSRLNADKAWAVTLYDAAHAIDKALEI